ncbi:hypothetical protein [Microbacterium sp. SD291]|uniref:hypothetical protein n=1 Tax=Microbacterium sp. SD291 TaxID=2782007 RepID=UPI001A9690D7|nr:hypothetical protein [Microbacterium sp. SD291]MBO0979895.1 hypothetical protein [Microbacterium sp. SD291]
MATDSETLKGILKELESITFLLGDVNEIRNGNYDPPNGSNPTPRPSKPRTFNDLYNVLDGIHVESMRQTELLESILDALGDEEEVDPRLIPDEPFDPSSI